MARRKLSQQQKNRIRDAQSALLVNQDFDTGQVISHRGGKIAVETSEGALIECTVKTNLGAIVCGDNVKYEKTPDGEYRVLAVEVRENLLRRLDGFDQIKTVAANLTQIFICLSVSPEPNLLLLDQYLVSAEQQELNAIIILNKTDLLANSKTDFFDLRSIYQTIGYEILYISTKTGQGIDELKSHLAENVSVLTGVSGVGKSSISNVLLPGVNIKTAEISTTNEEGRHTTRTSRLYHLKMGGDLIDTPGVRGFKPVLDGRLPASIGFREINHLSQYCRYGDCRHINEPRCAVLEALSQGEIAPSRYQNYLRLLEQSETAN